MGVELGLESGLGSVADDAIYFLPIFHDDICWNAEDVVSVTLIGMLVDVDDGELYFSGEVLLQLSKNRLHHLARAAPISVEI